MSYIFYEKRKHRLGDREKQEEGNHVYSKKFKISQ